MSLATDLPGAAARGELFAVFQPQVDVASDRIVGVEALCRWEHPELGLVPPIDFITLAEETGDVHEIGDFMIEQGCAFAADAETAELEVAVNVSAVQLERPGFGERLIEVYERHGLTAGSLTIELTESQPVLDVPGAVTQLWELRDRGIGISLDDFGAGHASARQLESLPFTELKIDQSLIREDTEETWSRVDALVAIVRHRGMRIVAEGIETPEQLEHIRASGCDRAQGYYLGIPLRRDDFLEYARLRARSPLPLLAAPARRALARLGLRNLQDVAEHTQASIRGLHGVGPKSVSQLGAALAAAGLAFTAE